MTDVPYNASNAAPAVGYRLPTGDEREQLRAEVARLRANLERVAAERDEARAERDRYRQLVGELQAALVRVADRLHEIERYARRTSDAEP